MWSDNDFVSRRSPDAEDAELRGAVRSLDAEARPDCDVDGVVAIQLGSNGQETIVADFVALDGLTELRLC